MKIEPAIITNPYIASLIATVAVTLIIGTVGYVMYLMDENARLLSAYLDEKAQRESAESDLAECQEMCNEMALERELCGLVAPDPLKNDLAFVNIMERLTA